jgi:hypothetical protein
MPIGKEEKEFALAYLNNEISFFQAREAYMNMRKTKHGMGVYVLIARAAKVLVQEGTLVVKK